MCVVETTSVNVDEDGVQSSSTSTATAEAIYRLVESVPGERVVFTIQMVRNENSKRPNGPRPRAGARQRSVGWRVSSRSRSTRPDPPPTHTCCNGNGSAASSGGVTRSTSTPPIRVLCFHPLVGAPYSRVARALDGRV